MGDHSPAAARRWLAFLVTGLALAGTTRSTWADGPGSANPGLASSPAPAQDDGDRPTARVVRLYYLRHASALATALSSLLTGRSPAAPEKGKPGGGSAAEALLAAIAAAHPGAGGDATSPASVPPITITSADEDALLLSGPRKSVDEAERLIAAIDLPRPGVNMQVWTAQVSSADPTKLSEAMKLAHKEIEHSRIDLQDTLIKLQEWARQISPDETFAWVLTGHQNGSDAASADREKPDQLPPGSLRLLQGLDAHRAPYLGYASALDEDRSLSISDIVLRIVAARQQPDPSKVAHGDMMKRTADAADLATKLTYWLQQKGLTRSAQAAETMGRRSSGNDQPMEGEAFARFFRSLGLEWDKDASRWRFREDARDVYRRARAAFLKFALYYQASVQHPDSFSVYDLQQSSGVLDAVLQPSVLALSKDMEDLFVLPTLGRIQQELRSAGVIYMQAGKTDINGLSGTESTVATTSISAFDVNSPVRLSDLSTNAQSLNDEARNFIGELGPTLRELQNQVSLNLTPNVLRNGDAAELQFVLKVGDPVAGTADSSAPKLARIGKHEVKTAVYVNSLDLLDISTYSGETTLDAGRGYVPLLGPVWHGVFGQVPVIGKLFSWRRDPEHRYHQSIVLAALIISPMSRGVAMLYPIPRDGQTGDAPQDDFHAQKQVVEQFIHQQRADDEATQDK
jgi:hypothetical protein